MQIGNRPCRIYGGANAEYLLLQMTGAHELQSMDYEVAAIAQSSQNFLLAGLSSGKQNDALSPWKAPAVWGKRKGSQAAKLGRHFTSDGAGHSHTGAAVSSPGKRQNHSGRLLAGGIVCAVGIHPDRFFWCRRRFSLCVVSGLDGVEQQHPIQAQHVYLSLGDKEERTKNTIMAAVGDNIATLHSSAYRAWRRLHP